MKNKKMLLLAVALLILAGAIMNGIDRKEEGLTSFQELFNAAYGYVDFSRYDALAVSAAKWMLPQLILFLFWGDYIEANLMYCLDYIRTRTSQLGRYLMHIVFPLFKVVLSVGLMLWFITVLAAHVQGAVMHMLPGWLPMIAWLLYLLLALLTANLLSLCMKSSYAVGVVLGGQLAMLGVIKLILAGTVSRSIYKWLPMSQVLFYYEDVLPKLGDRQGIMFLLLLLIGEVVFAVMFIKRKEWC